MPVYEFLCSACKRKVALYRKSFSPEAPSTCPNCGSPNIKRVFSTFSVRKTDKDIYESVLSDSQLVEGMARNDPRSLAEWNKRMSRGADEKTAPEYEEMLDKMERGIMPSELGGGQAPKTPEGEE